MKRRIAMLLIFLLLGAIVNIAVAWGCGLWPHAMAGSVLKALVDPGSAISPDETEWLRDAGCASFPSARRIRFTAFGMNRREFLEVPADSDSIIRSFAMHLSVGWPMLSCHGGAIVEYNQGMTSYVMVGAVALPGSGRRFLAIVPLLLPLKPLWPGFAINTLFYAAILWLLLALPGALRRWQRIKRGLCPACAYPVGASHLCTECGKPVMPSRQSAPGRPSPRSGRRRSRRERGSRRG